MRTTSAIYPMMLALVVLTLLSCIGVCTADECSGKSLGGCMMKSCTEVSCDTKVPKINKHLGIDAKLNYCQSPMGVQLTLDVLGKTVKHEVKGNEKFPIPGMTAEGVGVYLDVVIGLNNATSEPRLELGIEACIVKCEKQQIVAEDIPYHIHCHGGHHGVDGPKCSRSHHFTKADIIISVVSLVVGVALAFYGYRLFRIVLFLCGFMIGAAISFEIIMGATSLTEAESIGAAVAVGIVFGFITLCLYFVGMFAIGFAFGGLLGMLLISSMPPSVQETLGDKSYIPYSVAATLGVAGGILILCLQRYAIMLATSFIGAFGIIHMIDLYGNDDRMYEYFRVSLGHKDLSKPSCWVTDLLLALCFAITVVGFIVQHKITGSKYDHRKGRDKGTYRTSINSETQLLIVQ